MVLEFLVIGYYGHSNQGDEQYKYSITFLLESIFSKPLIHFVDCDLIQSLYVAPTTIVILGGGDVLNSYFLDKLNTRFPLIDEANGVKRRSNRIIALSVGIPYNNILSENYLEMFDAIFLRTRQDLAILSHINDTIGSRTNYFPDTSCLLLDALTPLKHLPRFIAYLQPAIDSKRRIVGISLCRHIYNPERPYRENYKKMVYELAFVVYHLVKEGYHVILVPFNTKTEPMASHLNKENDTLIQDDVWRLLSVATRMHVTNIMFELTTEEMMVLYTLFYICIPMRFHATMFSIYHHIPMIPIYTTKKIRNLLLDIDWKQYQIRLETNSLDLPIHLDRQAFMIKFRDLVRNYDRAKAQLRQVDSIFKQTIKNQYWILQNVIISNTETLLPLPNIKETSEISDESISLLGEESVNTVFPNLQQNSSEDFEVHQIQNSSEDFEAHQIQNTSEDLEVKTIQDLYEKLQTFAYENNIDDFRNIQDDELQQVVISVVSYHLTGSIDSQYNHGLSKKMFDPSYDFVNEWYWVYKDNKEKTRDISISNSIIPQLVKETNIKFNIDYIDQNDRSGVHRSGWKYVYDHLRPYHDSCSNLLVDLYVDKTFHWKRNVFKYIDIIPYKQPWIGFIHHTFDTTFSEYNNVRLLENEEFQKSLVNCKCLISLSNTLQHQLHSKLTYPVPIYSLVHPTELNVRTFSYQKFLENRDKYLLHIGGWLRNIFTFYQIDLLDSYKFTNLLEVIAPIPEVIQEQHIESRWSSWNCCSKNAIIASVLPPTISMSDMSKTNPIQPFKVSSLNKVVIKGKYMNNYFPPDHIESNQLTNTDSDATSIQCSRGGEVTNNFHRHLRDYVRNIYKTTHILEYVENDVYDDLLTKNIVFLHLVDGSAINTLIECFVRNTPIIINRHPAVIEVLGDEYPLYYDFDQHCAIQPRPSVSDLLSNPNCIWEAHSYLVKMDKSKYNISEFISNFLEIVKTTT
jgi:hypothetical protein